MWNGIENVRPHIVSIPDGNIHIRDEHVMFLLTQTFWLWKGYNLHWHITFGCKQVVFIHLNFTSIWIFIHLCCSSFFHPWLCFIHKYHSPVYMCRIFLHIMIYYMPCVKEYFSNILSTSTKYSKKDSFMFTCSCPLAQIHAPTLTI
jgi:hypothetical protein